MGPLHGLDYALVASFTLAAFVATAGTVVVSNFLPRTRGPESGRGSMGAVLVYGALVTVLLLISALLLTAAALPLAVAVVTAGLAFLAAPFAVQPLPPEVRNSRAALLAIVALSAGAIILLPTFGFF